MKMKIGKLQLLSNVSDSAVMCEIADKMRKIETLATDLRCELEELADIVYPSEVSISDADGESYTGYDFQDMANDVADIESLFFEED